MFWGGHGLELVGAEAGPGTWSEKVGCRLVPLSLPATCHLHEYAVPFLIFIYLSHSVLLMYGLGKMRAKLLPMG